MMIMKVRPFGRRPDKATAWAGVRRQTLIMSKFPSGPFTIVNQETGRCLRVRLGHSVDHSGYQLGARYLLSRTYPPSLELGPADGTMATAWYHRYHNDSLEPQPFNQIASRAVSDLQNIGDYGVWMYSDPLAQASEKASLREVRQHAQRCDRGSREAAPGADLRGVDRPWPRRTTKPSWPIRRKRTSTSEYIPAGHSLW
ncbi:hypothetical protein OHA84_01480 [Streptomyces sp. NBC_00513]|uniref:hypothetical protein n=1 Tax=unclassified Streptomyces TaxID=2593676 RepID=UPI00224EFAF5|nr:hypothetical protein [Streptomyces sp. NBC_00424]MCX5079163.1 hypothetical protein [Streptomyces sp. NBC_00424]WUD39274.1 hypothetical protein OHA84_01480 [Streptomyces sp. NBC_00513]